jgi:hypothetical protein
MTAGRCGRRRRLLEACSWGRDMGGILELLRDDGAALAAAMVHHRAPTRRRRHDARFKLARWHAEARGLPCPSAQHDTANRP